MKYYSEKNPRHSVKTKLPVVEGDWCRSYSRRSREMS